jgi:hypothetical protein
MQALLGGFGGRCLIHRHGTGIHKGSGGASTCTMRRV